MRTTYNSPTPVNVVGAERMQQLAIPDVATALNQIPSFRATTSASTILFRVNGAIGGNTPDLRGLGTSRTLVLVDGRRFVPSVNSGGVDLNGVPNALVKRSEVVTGGASAAYGADAVAGVVNLILDTKFNGLKIDASAGVSDRGDGKNYFLSVAGGRGFAGDRGHVIAGFEYRDDKGVGNCFQREWCAKLTNFVPNPGYIGGVSTNGLPATLVLDNVNFVYTASGVLLSAVQTVGGVKTTLGQQVNNTGATALPAALRGLQFNAAGNALVPFQFGNYLSGTFMQGGDAAASNNWGWGNPPLVTPTSHGSGIIHVDYDLTPRTQAFGEFIYSRTQGGPVRTSVLLQAPAGGSAGIDINNPFITPAVRAQILAANPNITAINVNVAVAQGGDTVVASSTNNIYRFVTGLKGDLFKDWRWDASYEYGQTDSRTDVKNTRLASFDTQATNAITPPAGYAGPIYTTPAGAPVICASSVANPSDGCLPVDLFGQNITPAVLNKYFKDEFQTRTIKQHDLMVNFRGTLFELPAGAVQAAFGGEYRHDSVSGDVDALTKAGLFAAPQVTALPQVTQKVTEGYAEANIPLLADLPLAKSLSVDLTGRYTHYSGFGNAKPWKVGVEYQPNDQILVRVTRSSDIRAPTAAESNPNTVQTFLPLNDPFSGSNHLVGALAGGNPNLELESAKTNTAGIVLKPNFLPGFHASVDWYDITVKNAIDSVSAPNILSACATKNPVQPDHLQRRGQGQRGHDGAVQLPERRSGPRRGLRVPVRLHHPRRLGRRRQPSAQRQLREGPQVDRGHRSDHPHERGDRQRRFAGWHRGRAEVQDRRLGGLHPTGLDGRGAPALHPQEHPGPDQDRSRPGWLQHQPADQRQHQHGQRPVLHGPVRVGPTAVAVWLKQDRALRRDHQRVRQGPTAGAAPVRQSAAVRHGRPRLPAGRPGRLVALVRTEDGVVRFLPGRRRASLHPDAWSGLAGAPRVGIFLCAPPRRRRWAGSSASLAARKISHARHEGRRGLSLRPSSRLGFSMA